MDKNTGRVSGEAQDAGSLLATEWWLQKVQWQVWGGRRGGCRITEHLLWTHGLLEDGWAPRAGREGVFGALTGKRWDEKLMDLASISQRSCQRTSSISWTNGKPRNGQLRLVITHSFILSTNIYSPPTNSERLIYP